MDCSTSSLTTAKRIIVKSIVNLFFHRIIMSHTGGHPHPHGPHPHTQTRQQLPQYLPAPPPPLQLAARCAQGRLWSAPATRARPAHSTVTANRGGGEWGWRSPPTPTAASQMHLKSWVRRRAAQCREAYHSSNLPARCTAAARHTEAARHTTAARHPAGRLGHGQPLGRRPRGATIATSLSRALWPSDDKSTRHHTEAHPNTRTPKQFSTASRVLLFHLSFHCPARRTPEDEPGPPLAPGPPPRGV